MIETRAFLEARAAAGDAEAAKCLRFLDAARGRNPIDVGDELHAIRELLEAGLKQSVAIATVARRVGTNRRVKTWRRRLKETGT